MKKCAYCNMEGMLTKEHIWPRNIIRKYKEKLATYNNRTNSLIPTEPTIKDVCENCNNTTLSKLDTYLSTIYDSQLHRCLLPGESAQIDFNYHMLLRVLLKISFNSARAFADERTIKAHQQFAKFIIDGKFVSNVQLRLLVVTSAKIMADDVLLEQQFPVTQLRCASVAYSGILSHRFIVRLVAINSFWFYLIISLRTETPDKWKVFVDGFSSWKIQPGIHVKQNANKLVIPANQTTYMHPKLVETLLVAIASA